MLLQNCIMVSYIPINGLVNGSNSLEIRIDTSLFLQKPSLRTYYLESIVEEDID